MLSKRQLARIFICRAQNSQGRIINGSIRADSPNNAAVLLLQKKLNVLMLKPKKFLDLSIGCRHPGVNIRDLAEFCRQFATLLNCGVSIIQCLNILSQQSANKTLVRTLKGLMELLKDGLSLSEAARSYPRVFPQVFTSMLEAGELSGSMDLVLERAATHFEKEYDLREKIKSAITYPVVVMVVAIVAVAILLVFVLPIFVNILIEYNAALPFVTKTMLSISSFMNKYWHVVAAVFGFFYLGFKYLVKTPHGKTFFDGLLTRIPVFGGLTKRIITARFSRTLATLLGSGVSLLMAFDVIKKIVDNAIVEQAIIEAIKCVREGQGIAQPLQQSGVFPPMATRMIAIGEETGELASMLEKLAQFYEREVEHLVSRLSSIIEPILIISMGGIVGFIILAVMLPMFSVMNSIQ